MKSLKKLMVVLLTVIMIMPLTAYAAPTSPSKTSLKKATATAQSVVYNGKKQTAQITVTLNGKTLEYGKDFVVDGSRKRKNAGTYSLKIKGIGKYTGTKTVKFTVKKADRNVQLTYSGKPFRNGAKNYRVSTLETKTRSFTINVIKKGTVGVTFTSSSDALKVTKNGKVTVKIGTKAGLYNVYVNIKETKNYNAFKQVVKVRVYEDRK